MRTYPLSAGAVAAALMIAAMPAHAIIFPAGSTCTYAASGSTVELQGDCTTPGTVLLEDGETLDGRGFAITAMNGADGDFDGAVVATDMYAREAHVTDLVVQADGIDNGDGDLAGIRFENASGSIRHSTVQGINFGASGAQEGIAILVRNDGLAARSVEIAHNVVEDYQKGAVVADGDELAAHVHHNLIGASATQANLGANAVQVSRGASALVESNHIAGNQWKGTTNFFATAVILYAHGDTVVRRNNIGGNSDVGIASCGAACGGAGIATLDNNRVFDGGKDHPNSAVDIGILDYDETAAITNNKLRGFETPIISSSDTDGQKIVPGDADPKVCFGTDC